MPLQEAYNDVVRSATLEVMQRHVQFLSSIPRLTTLPLACSPTWSPP